MEKISGKYLKDLREERGYSLRTFADMIYVSKSSVQRWEQSFIPENAALLESVAKVFNLSVEEMRRQSKLKYGNENKWNDTAGEIAASKTTDNADMPAAKRQKSASAQKQFTELSSTAKHIAAAAALLFILSFLFILWIAM